MTWVSPFIFHDNAHRHLIVWYIGQLGLSRAHLRPHLLIQLPLCPPGSSLPHPNRPYLCSRLFVTSSQPIRSAIAGMQPRLALDPDLPLRLSFRQAVPMKSGPSSPGHIAPVNPAIPERNALEHPDAPTAHGKINLCGVYWELIQFVFLQ